MKYLPLMMALMMPMAADAAKKATATPKAIPMADIVRDSMAKGKDYRIDDSRGGKLDYVGNPAAKKFILDGGNDLTQHAVIVTLKDDGKANDVIISSSTGVVMDGKPVSVDGYSFRTDLSGNLIAGMHAVGNAGNVQQLKLDPAGADTKAIFDRVMTTVRHHKVFSAKKK